MQSILRELSQLLRSKARGLAILAATPYSHFFAATLPPSPFQHTHTQSKHEVMGGIAAIEALIKIEAPGVNTAVNSNMFGQYLLNVFPPMGADLELIANAATVVGEP